MSVISRIKKGENEAFNEIIQENSLKFYKTAKAILKNDDDVYDVIQEALISMYNNITTLKNDKYFTTWGVRIVINKCYDFIRKNKREVCIENVEDISTQEKVYDKYNLDPYGLEKVLSYLDEELHLIVVLYYYDELKVKEIAKTLNEPEGTIKFKLSKARNILKEKLRKEDF